MLEKSRLLRSLQLKMTELPTSFLVVLAVVVFAIGLILYFFSKQFLFRRHKCKGEEAFRRGAYRDAIKCFARAEALWELNVNKQTTQSYQRDLTMLQEILNGFQAAARAEGITLSLDEYLDAVLALQSEFRGNDASERGSRGKTYASAFMRLKSAQSTLRDQLHLLNSNGCVRNL